MKCLHFLSNLDSYTSHMRCTGGSTCYDVKIFSRETTTRLFGYLACQRNQSLQLRLGQCRCHPVNQTKFHFIDLILNLNDKTYQTYHKSIWISCPTPNKQHIYKHGFFLMWKCLLVDFRMMHFHDSPWQPDFQQRFATWKPPSTPKTTSLSCAPCGSAWRRGVPFLDSAGRRWCLLSWSVYTHYFEFMILWCRKKRENELSAVTKANSSY